MTDLVSLFRKDLYRRLGPAWNIRALERIVCKSRAMCSYLGNCPFAGHLHSNGRSPVRRKPKNAAAVHDDPDPGKPFHITGVSNNPNQAVL